MTRFEIGKVYNATDTGDGVISPIVVVSHGKKTVTYAYVEGFNRTEYRAKFEIVDDSEVFFTSTMNTMYKAKQ
jgi:hypothetical protein